MRREDTRYRFLLKEIQAFTGIYKTTARNWFMEFTSDSSNVTDQEHGYRHVFPGQVLARIEGFDTIKGLFQPFGPLPQPTCIFLLYRDTVLTPFNDEMEPHLAEWWRQAWRCQHLDFAHIPPAPSQRPEALISHGFRTWRYTDQFLITIEGGTKARRCRVSTLTGYVLWQFPLPPTPLRLLPELLLPRLHRLAALTDWREVEHLSPPVSRALTRRTAQLIAFYTSRPFRFLRFPCLHAPSHPTRAGPRNHTRRDTLLMNTCSPLLFQCRGPPSIFTTPFQSQHLFTERGEHLHMSETPAPQNTHFPVATEHPSHAHPSYRYLMVGGRILDREHIVTLIDHRSHLLAPGIEVVQTHERLASFLVQGDDQETLLGWYLQAPPRAPQPFLRLGAHLLARTCICEVIENSVEGDTTLLLRYLSLPDPLMGDAESSIQTLELHGQSADAVRQWLSTQTEVIVPLQPVACTPSIAQDSAQDAPICPHCESWLTPLWNTTTRTLTLVCLLCHYTDGPFLRAKQRSATSDNNN